MDFGGLTSSNANDAARRIRDLVDAERPNGPNSGIGFRVNSIVRLVDRLFKQARPSTQASASSDAQSRSLGEAFAEVPAESGLSPDVRFRVIVDGRQQHVKPSLHDEIYCIVREAIVNAYRHSAARDVEAQIVYRPGGLRISVCDNGCGIDPRTFQWGRTGYSGISGMCRRAERLGGQLRILSKVARGTEVELCLPGNIAFA